MGPWKYVNKDGLSATLFTKYSRQSSRPIASTRKCLNFGAQQYIQRRGFAHLASTIGARLSRKTKATPREHASTSHLYPFKANVMLRFHGIVKNYKLPVCVVSIKYPSLKSANHNKWVPTSVIEAFLIYLSQSANGCHAT